MTRKTEDLHLAGKDANTLHDLLLDGKNFKVPDFKFDDIDLPDLDGFNKLPDHINVGDLTERKYGGKGVFDALMESVSNHVDREVEAGRITENEYTKHFVSMLEASMANAVQFLLQKDASYWQGITAQIQALQARVQLEVTIQQAKAQLANLKYDALVKEVQYTNTKMGTLTMESNYQNSEYNLNNILPANENLIKEQREVQRAQTSNERTDGKIVKGSIGKGMELNDAQIIAFSRDAQYKVAKIHSDLWVSMRSTDEDLLPPSTFTNDAIARVITSLKKDVSL